jgi:hypothetical protein
MAAVDPRGALEPWLRSIGSEALATRHRETCPVTSEGECRRVARELLGDAIQSVTYVGLTYDDPSAVAWDFGDWHWPEVGVELAMASGRVCHAIWDSTITHFELTFAEGPIADSWLPLQATSPGGRSWDVTAHPRWQPLVGEPITGHDLTLFAPDDPPVEVPVAIRLITESAAVWIVAAAPREYGRAMPELERDDIFLGHDEVIAVFSDHRAHALGL